MNDAEDLFDHYAAAYEEALSNAIAPSGESREYFAEGRVAWLKRCLEKQANAREFAAGLWLRRRRDNSFTSRGI